ncbi:protein FAM13B isoform X2 [Pleurodeles waltl]|uniref:protein FAM13B isoform X2 n=1 Tax=Pleurodeles waltl TaxID=8319 RepID=UPI00370965E6
MRKSSSPSSGNVIASKIFGIPLEELQQEGQTDNEVPFIVRHIVDYIEEHGRLDREGLFHVNGNAETVEWLRRRYDSGEEVDLVKEADVPSAISLLRYFLQELPEPVIPATLHTHLMQLSQDFTNEDEFVKKLKNLLQQLPAQNFSLLKFLCRFLSSVASHNEEMWSTSAVAAVFGPDVFQSAEVEDVNEQDAVSRIVGGLLESYFEFFEAEDDEFSSTNDLSSITEQINDLLEEEDDKLEHTDELPEDIVGKSDDVQEVLNQEMNNSLVESSSIADSSREAFGEGVHTEQDCTRMVTCSEGVEEEPEDPKQENRRPQQEEDILLELTNVDGDKDTENNVRSKRKPNGCPVDCDTFSSRLILDSYSEICDLNANPESDVRAGSGLYADCDAVHIQIPHLELRSVSEEDCWEEPFPAFKTWQGDTETGEAQLSPQAGRLNYTMEEEVFPMLSHRCLDFGQSQRFLHDPEAADSSKALSFVRTRRASFSSKDERTEDKTPHQLVKKLQKKIRQFEEQFERENKSKPSYSDLAANPKVLKWMTDLTKLRKQIKDAKHKSPDGDLDPQSRPRSNTLPKSFGSSLDHEDEEGVEEAQVEKKPTREDTLELILKKLKEKRAEHGLPEEMKIMTKDNLADEKTSLQKSLLYYESLHGRPVTREERQFVKPLYDRYRLVKQMLTRASITPILGSPSTKRRGQMLQPIIEGETSHFFEDIKEEDEEAVSMSSESSDAVSPAVQTECVRSQEDSESAQVQEYHPKMALDIRLSSSRASSMPELLEQLWKARAEKKKLRKTLREFEEEFFKQNGRNAQKEDRAHRREEYREYKKIKAKLRLLEVLISKQDSSKSI